MARRACCRGQAIRGPRAVILPRRIGAVHGGGVVWGDHLQVDSHQCLQTFWNLAKCQMRVVSHYLYRAFFITLLQPAIAWRRTSSLPLLSVQCLGDVAPSLKRAILPSAASAPARFPFHRRAASVCFYSSWISKVLAPWLAVGV